MDPQTRGKHLVLRAYLDAWIPIMGFSNERIVFIDGFAGPGEYADGEEGSPIIALRALAEHSAKGRIRAKTMFYFIELDGARAAHLEEKVKPFREQLPTAQIAIEQGECDAILTGVLDAISERKMVLAPSFVMLDPFGVSHTPLSLIERVLKNPKSEIYISFMWEWIDRFKETGEFEGPMDDLFGTTEWRGAIKLPTSQERKEYLYTLYDRQLRTAGAKYVTYFELFSESRHVYTIFFATKHHVGMDRMKQAIWRADTSGRYQFRGRVGSEQIVLELEYAANLPELQRQIRAEFGGDQPVASEAIMHWAQTDATDFHSGHVKSALRNMEKAGEIEVDATTRQRRFTYPDGTAMKISPL